MKQHILEEPSTSSIDWDTSVIRGRMMPPRDPDQDEEDEDEEDDDDDGEEDPPTVREPDED